MLERDNRVITTYGLSDEQNLYVKSCFPSKEYTLRNCNHYKDSDFTDMISTQSTIFIINAPLFPEHAHNMMWEFYDEINESFDETVIWLGEPKPPQKIANNFKCYNNFDEIKENLKFILLAAHKRTKKATEYCKTLEKGIRILSLIRKNPGITTKELSQITEMSIRSVQRYIEALQTAGEWIEYDTQRRGWKLHNGFSVLFETNFIN